MISVVRIGTHILIGVISDTHGLLRPEALAILRGSELRTIAPVTVVRGNVDKGAWARKLHETEVVEFDGVSIYVLHDLSQLDLKPEAAGFSVVISGHSHVPKQETRGDVLYFNPGSAGPRRFKLPICVGKLVVEAGEVRAEILKISD